MKLQGKRVQKSYGDLDLDLDSSRIHVDTLWLTPTSSVAVKSCQLCVLPAEPHLLSRSLSTLLFQFVRGRPGPLLYPYGTEWPILCWCAVKKLLPHSLILSLLYPGASQYNACCGMRWWSIHVTCPSQPSRLSLCMLSMVRCPKRRLYDRGATCAWGNMSHTLQLGNFSYQSPADKRSSSHKYSFPRRLRTRRGESARVATRFN